MVAHYFNDWRRFKSDSDDIWSSRMNFKWIGNETNTFSRPNCSHVFLSLSLESSCYFIIYNILAVEMIWCMMKSCAIFSSFIQNRMVKICSFACEWMKKKRTSNRRVRMSAWECTYVSYIVTSHRNILTRSAELTHSNETFDWLQCKYFVHLLLTELFSEQSFFFRGFCSHSLTLSLTLYFRYGLFYAFSAVHAVTE